MTTTADLLFPVYDVFATLPTDTSATVTVKCPKGATVTIDKGNAPTYDPRLMKGAGPDVLAYNLFLGGYSTIWGDGTGGTSTWITPTGNATATIYARIPAGQDVSAGAYSDSVVLTVFP